MNTLMPSNQRATVGHHPGGDRRFSASSAFVTLAAAALLSAGLSTSRAEESRPAPVAPPTAPPALVAEPRLPEAGAPGRRARAMRTVPQTTTHASAVTSWRERAENVDHVTASLGSARPAVQDAVVAEGAGAFQLANPDWQTESITLAPAVLPAEGTKLFFESRIGHATSTQFARLQVSADNGANWTNLWSRAGSDGPGDGGFRLETVELSAYAGSSIRLRFLYEAIGDYAYVDTDPSSGWFIDDIQIGEAFLKRPYLSTGDPTPEEILLLEFINRARADANAEANRLAADTDADVLFAVDYFNVNFTLMRSQFAALQPTAQPLAMNAQLLAAARLHSRDMLDNVFQGHTSSASPPAPNMAFDGMVERVERQGYVYSSLGENVYAFAESPWYAHAAFNIDWGAGPGGMQSPAGHRLAIHDPLYREVGIGMLEGSKTSGGTTVGPLVVTQNFGAGAGGGQPLITGVSFVDADHDNFYDPGEGLAGVRVEVEGSSYYTESSSHGAYAIPVPADGTYRVSFQRPGHAPVSRQVTVSGGLNVKADYRGESIVVTSAERTSATGVRLLARQTRAPQSLALQFSGDLVSWNDLPHTAAQFPDGVIRLDANLPTAASRSFFRISADWEE